MQESTTRDEVNNFDGQAGNNELPKYCDYSKFMLVEELALEPDYRELHYGQCTIIGKLNEHPAGYFVLENINLPNFPKKYSLPEGAVYVRLFRFTNTSLSLQSGKFCEACGEVVLWNTRQPSDNWVPLTSRGVNEKLLRLQGNESTRTQWLKNLQETHKPALRLVYLNYIDHAGELAERNLRLRGLHEQRLQK